MLHLCHDSIHDVQTFEYDKPVLGASHKKLTGTAVYIYRIVLDSINGVSSTKSTSIAAIDLLEGEIRQIQFVDDDSLMILWSNSRMCFLPCFSISQAPRS